MAVAFSVLVCGWAPAVLSALVGFFGVLYWFVDPRHPLSFVPQEIRGIIGFVLVSTVLIVLGKANRRKQSRLNKAVAALTLETQERKRTEEELQKAHDRTGTEDSKSARRNSPKPCLNWNLKSRYGNVQKRKCVACRFD